MPMGDQRSASDRTRRDFLKTAGLAASAFALPLPRVRLGASPNEALQIGLIGTGGMGGGHLDALMRLHKEGAENFRIVALADVCKTRLDHWVEKCSTEQKTEVKGYADYKELLARDDIDAVWVATPEHWHAQMTIDAVQAKKDVYVEKPMTLDLKDALRVYEVAKKTDRIIEVGTQYVTDPKYIHAGEMIAAGKIGKAVTSETGYCRNSKDGEWNYYGIDERVKPGVTLDWKGWCGPLGEQAWDTLIYHRWRRYRKYSTGIVGDLLVHQMTPLIKALDQGWPVHVVAIGGHYVDTKMENHDQVNILVQFEKGHTMTIVGSTCNANGPTPVVRGHKGTIYLSGNKCRLAPEKLYAEEIDGEEKASGGDSHDNLRLDFLRCVRERKQPLATVELGTQVMVIVDLATRAMWEGKAFSFDPKTMSSRAL